MHSNNFSFSPIFVALQLFTALTSCVICALLLIIHCVGDKEWMLLLIEFLMNVLFCIFWLISSILSTLEFISVSNWPALEKDACGAVGPLQVGPPNYCKAYSRRYALNALCAVSWTAWIFWLYSIYISISIDIRKKKIFVDLSKKFKKSSRSRTCLSNMEEANPSASSTAYQNTDIWKLLGSRLLHATGIKTSAPSSKSVSSDKYSSSQEDGSSEDAKTNRAPAEKLIQG